MSENKNTKEKDTKMNESPETKEEQTSASAKAQAETPGKKSTADSENEKTVSEAEQALTELQAKYDILNDKYLRLYSEFENFRRRTAKEKLDSMHSGSADLVRDLLPVIDDFDRALSSNEIVDDPEALKEGFKLIHSKFLRVLEQKGLKSMDSMEKPFDTEYHEAITNIPAPTDDLKGKVVDVAEKGYFFKDKIIRYAKVVVGQ